MSVAPPVSCTRSIPCLHSASMPCAAAGRISPITIRYATTWRSRQRSGAIVRWHPGRHCAVWKRRPRPRTPPRCMACCSTSSLPAAPQPRRN
jgi:hypothetical protein